MFGNLVIQTNNSFPALSYQNQNNYDDNPNTGTWGPNAYNGTTFDETGSVVNVNDFTGWSNADAGFVDVGNHNFDLTPSSVFEANRMDVSGVTIPPWLTEDFLGRPRDLDNPVFGAYDPFGPDSMTTGGTTEFRITSPIDGETGVMSPVVVSGTLPNDGQNQAVRYEIINETTGLPIVADYSGLAVVDTVNETWTADISSFVPQGGETIRVRARRWGDG